LAIHLGKYHKNELKNLRYEHDESEKFETSDFDELQQNGPSGNGDFASVVSDEVPGGSGTSVVNVLQQNGPSGSGDFASVFSDEVPGGSGTSVVNVLQQNGPSGSGDFASVVSDEVTGGIQSIEMAIENQSFLKKASFIGGKILPNFVNIIKRSFFLIFRFQIIYSIFIFYFFYLSVKKKTGNLSIDSDTTYADKVRILGKDLEK
jgi:hypothetical protein